MISIVRTLAPNALIVAMAYSVAQMAALKMNGANEVLLPYSIDRR